MHRVRTRRSADDFPRGEQLAAQDRRSRHRSGCRRARDRGDGAQPDHRQRRRQRRFGAASTGRGGPSSRRWPIRTRQGATVFGVDGSYSAEWAAWANSVAVRELDFHDTFLAAEYSHPGDNIPPLVAVAQQLGVRGSDLIRGLATAYEIQIDLVKGISLHEFKIDHIAHLGPSVAAGIGTMLRLDAETIYQAVGQALHLTTSHPAIP